MESINEFFHTGLDIHILVKSTEQKYRTGYGRFLKANEGFYWYEESPNDFKDQVMAIVSRFNHPWTLCFCDDDVVVDHVDVVSFLKYITYDVNALSLRMGTHIDYCYPKDMKMVAPSFTVASELIKWRWVDYQRGLDWGYSMSLAGNIYRAEWLKDIWLQIPFTSPNLIEGLMAMRAPAHRPCQLSFSKQRVYNVANNLVQDVCANRHEGDPWMLPDVLNKQYLKGKKIDLSKIAGKVYNSANGPAIYEMINQRGEHREQMGLDN